MKKIRAFSVCLLVIFNISFMNIEPILAHEKVPKLVFPVISDVHIGKLQAEGKFIKALKDLKEQSSSYDAIALVGDITNAGEKNQYKRFMNILNSNKVKTAEALITMGNHEYFSSKNITEKGSEKRFIQETKVPSLYYDKWIKGYHFIVLAPEKSGSAKLSSVQLNWLKGKLQEKEDKVKPIFVFLHQPIKETVYGSNDCGHIDNYKELYEILKNHSQVVFFSGHSHYLLEHPRTMYQKDFTAFNTASICYTSIETDVPSSPMYSQGLLVEVYDKEIVVKCRDFSRSKWIGEEYTVKYPIKSVKQRDKKNPYWRRWDKVKTKKGDNGSLIIYWPKAKDDTLVTSYIIKVNGEVVKKMVNNFLYKEDNYHLYKVTGLKKSEQYNIEIEAIDAFNKKSSRNLKATA